MRGLTSLPMRIARGLAVEDIGDGGVRLKACDWPWAAWFGAALLAPGAALVLWSLAAPRHWIEFGGGAVFCAFGAAALGVSRTRRRAIDISAGLDGVSINGTVGAWPFVRHIVQDLAGDVRIEIRPFAVPQGAPDLPDRGGDLLLVSAAAVVLLSRRVGPGWRGHLEAARDRVVAGIPAVG